MSGGYAEQLRASLYDHAALPAISFEEEHLTYAGLAESHGCSARQVSAGRYTIWTLEGIEPYVSARLDDWLVPDGSAVPGR